MLVESSCVTDCRHDLAYRPVLTGTEETLVEVELITGKTHQIRAHLASIGHPLAGDGKYGEERFNQYFREKYRLKNQLLHAYEMEIPEIEGKLQYLSGKIFTAEIPALFAKIKREEQL